MDNLRPLHYNIPQIKAMMVAANETYIVASRGTGKSSGIQSPWLLRNNALMPRSMNGIIGATYQQLLIRTLPPVIENWTRMGYRRDTHFFIGKKPPDKWNWPRPLAEPLDPKHAIYWFNGSVNVLISQDRTGTSNGLSLASVAGDEAKLLDKAQFDDETMPTLRGHLSHFGHLSCYGSILFTTDMPTASEGMWILDKSKVMNPEIIECILQMQLLINKLEAQALVNPSQGIHSKLKEFYKLINELRYGRKMKDGSRQNTVYYDEADATTNLDVLGPDFIPKMRRNLSDLKFRTSIMNERILKVEGGFYSLLDPKQHGADWFDYTYLDSLDYDFRKLTEESSLQDAGVDVNRPIEVAMDYGMDMNCLVAGQEHGSEFRLLKDFYVLHPQLTAHVVDLFCNYYRFHKTKDVVYYWDHTAKQGAGTSLYTYYEQVRERFAFHGWRVLDVYIGQSPAHDRKYDFWNILLRGEHPDLPLFKYSKTHCSQWMISASGAGIRKGRNGYEKDKRSEQDNNVKPENATHLSDAADTLLWGKYNHRLSDNQVTAVPLSFR